MAANTINVTNQTQLQTALSSAANQPITCINITNDLIQINASLTLPKTLFAPGKTLIINGNGATIQPIGASLGTLMSRIPVNQSEATGSMDSCRFIIKDLTFNGKTGVGTGIDLGASTGSVIENCTFKSLTSGVIARYSRLTRIINCVANGIGGVAFQIDKGNWAGSTTTNSQSGHCRIEQCRVVYGNGSYAGVAVYASTGVEVNQCVMEGGSTQYHIFYDSYGNENVKSFFVNNVEFNIPASIAAVKLKLAAGYAKVSGIQTDMDMTLVAAEAAAGYPHLYVENIPFISSGTKFETMGAAVVWSFNEVYQGDQIFNVSRWTNGVVPYYRYSEYFNQSKAIITDSMKVNNNTIS